MHVPAVSYTHWSTQDKYHTARADTDPVSNFRHAKIGQTLPPGKIRLVLTDIDHYFFFHVCSDSGVPLTSFDVFKTLPRRGQFDRGDVHNTFIGTVVFPAREPNGGRETSPAKCMRFSTHLGDGSGRTRVNGRVSSPRNIARPSSNHVVTALDARGDGVRDGAHRIARPCTATEPAAIVADRGLALGQKIYSCPNRRRAENDDDRGGGGGGGDYGGGERDGRVAARGASVARPRSMIGRRVQPRQRTPDEDNTIHGNGSQDGPPHPSTHIARRRSVNRRQSRVAISVRTPSVQTSLRNSCTL
ncbi:Hypothetical protein CINCED_3A000189 [Cinara cedri]|uniref:Uncharacterized protein n=1 Tax=Cinara cedri TaxID=506608 RepID=A0A5E4N1R0_9HEMI|nr:Hypothetical protein CINCED_3A000189 [Cinara cedri]